MAVKRKEPKHQRPCQCSRCVMGRLGLKLWRKEIERRIERLEQNTSPHVLLQGYEEI